MSNSDLISVRKILPNDLSFGLLLSEEAGWNQTSEDWARSLLLDPQGCFLAEINSEPAGTTTCCAFGDIGWIAMVLVHKKFQGRGIGEKLVRKAIEYLNNSGVQTIRLDATAQGQRLYEKLGFISEFEVVRFAGKAKAKSSDITHWNKGVDSGVNNLKELAQFDEHISATDRELLIKALDSKTYYYIKDNEGKLLGYANYRIGRHAIQIGPSIALNSNTGILLLDFMVAHLENKECYIDIPTPNISATNWAIENGFKPQRSFIRMYKGKWVNDKPELIWASFGPEKG